MITSKLVVTKGSWGLTFFSFIVAFLGNYTAIFESAADYSRELKPGMSNKYRGFLYLCPILFAYGITVLTGAMLAAVTGISSPVNAMAVLFHNRRICRTSKIAKQTGTLLIPSVIFEICANAKAPVQL